MRPVVRAVGLICILSHNYLIVKIKMLFRYSVAIVDNKLSVYPAPILTTSGPLFRDVFHSKIQHLEKAVISRKYGLCFGNFSKLAIKAFYCVGSIYQPAKLLRESEIGAEVRPVISYHDFDILGYLLSQTAKFESISDLSL